MTDIEINKKLHKISFKEEDSSIKYEIALQAIETENPAQFLRDMYGNKGMKYDLNEDSFIPHAEDIVRTIQNHETEISLNLGLDNYVCELSFLAFQISLQELLISFDALSNDELLF